MSEIICPVCNYPTVPNGIEDIEDNIICPACYRHGSKKLWDSFISTKKKLDEAIDLLKMLYGDYNLDWSVVDSDKVYDFLKQINQKDVK